MHGTGDPSHLAYQIELQLQRISLAPDDLALHQQLRFISLRYKANGGKPAGMFEKIKPPPSDLIQRLLHQERIWARDPGNMDWVFKILAALADIERANPSRRCAPVRQWFYDILKKASDT